MPDGVLDDSELYFSYFSEVCTFCKHLDEQSIFGEKKICKAFKNGIPSEIWTGNNKHTKSINGDNGIIFSPADTTQ
jgi:hypothetical protein